MKFPQFPVEFTKDGAVWDEAQVQALLDGLPGCTDLLVLTHGWNHDMPKATSLYDRLTDCIAAVLAQHKVDGLEGRTIGVLRVYWPSKRFGDTSRFAAGGAVGLRDAAEAPHAESIRLLQELKRNPERLGGQELDPIRSANIDAAVRLLPALETDAAVRREFVLRLRAILNPSAASADDGSDVFFTRDTEALFEQLKQPAALPLGPLRAGGAAELDAEGGAADLSDLFQLPGNFSFSDAALKLINFSTYFEMKARAGIIGVLGLAPLLRRIRQAEPALRLHLLGHSFGGRVVTAAVHALPDGTPAVTMLLLQAAFSHNGLASRYDGKHDGDYRAVLSKARASGPILITHTRNDLALGISYPLASAALNQQASGLDEPSDLYGGMGLDGAQHTPEVDTSVPSLLDVGDAYAFAPGKVFNLNADAFIMDHSDVVKPQVAYALLSAMRAV